MSILLVGSGGYLGKELKFFLKNKNTEIFEVSSKGKNKRIFSYDKIPELKFLKKLESIIILSGLDEKEANQNLKKAITLKKKVLTSIFELSKKIELGKIIYLSSVKIYSETNNGIINENSKLFSNTNYAKSHLFAEEYIKKNFKREKRIILRLSNIYGSNINIANGKKYFLNYIIHSLKIKKRIKINSSSVFYRDYISINFFLKTIHFLTKKKINYQIINICSGEMTSLLDILNKVKRINNFIINKNKTDFVQTTQSFKFCNKKINSLKIFPNKKIQIKKYI